MTGEGNSRSTLLLVHGAWHGSWCWAPLSSALRAEGRRTETVDLPSAGREAGMHEDAGVVLDALTRIDGPVVVVAHSYGGIPVTQAAAEAPNVERIVYLSAFQLDVGENLLGHYGAPEPDEPQGFEPVPGDPVPMFYGDVPRSEARAAARRLVPQSRRSFSDRLTRAAWRGVPSTYVVCEDDQALPARNQEAMAARSGTVHRIAGGHSPFLSRPAELAALLGRIGLGADG
ncbi:alpha/beta hydrolase [Streptomyces chengbuensis]|uniref:alpha/beta fold hydrolase n=1 Tax=Streptomyces chengbuensis TaxID=3053466 RepID=UPI0025B2F8CD|nr:alpha/beta hydrolase [Streptomyces sp. HUAS CB01]WJY54059.1 alpha/beta hydrolase [Streptomyces sp. HUAS CB01]